jgi:energy-coupling factor transporter ATP-binding protein EcfA2
MGGEVGHPIVAFEGVCYRYDEGGEALTGIDLRVLCGEYVALIGANGSGKTTLGKHVNGLLRPQAGRVLVAGDDTRGRSPGELARRVGYVFQNPDHQIFAATVRDEIAFGPGNLGLARTQVERRAADAMETFHLAGLADVPPATLGYGQRRLVTLASVHAMQPEILVLDEPSTGLDAALTARLVEWVSLLHRAGATVLFITHDMQLAALAGRCVVLESGHVILDAPPAEVFACPEALARAGIAPPPIARLSQQLGLAETLLSVDGFCQLLARRHGEVDVP